LSLQERYATKNNAPEFKRAFEVLDRKQDGKIDVAELCQFLRERGLKIKKVRAADCVQATVPALCRGPGRGALPPAATFTFGRRAGSPPQSEAEAMLWEVDEDCDGCVNWQEFQRMYERSQADPTGAASTVRPPAGDPACRWHAAAVLEGAAAAAGGALQLLHSTAARLGTVVQPAMELAAADAHHPGHTVVLPPCRRERAPAAVQHCSLHRV
jgi:hypothetical protein